MNTRLILAQLRDSGIADELLRTVGLSIRERGVVRLLSGIGIFAAGALLGAGIGLGLAPMRGEEMRERAREGVDTVRSRLRDMRTRVEERAEELRERARTAAGEMKNARTENE